MSITQPKTGEKIGNLVIGNSVIGNLVISNLVITQPRIGEKNA